MKTIRTAEELVALQQSLAAMRDPEKVRITVCGGTGCRTSGSETVIDAFRQALEAQRLDATVEVMVTGCHGFCERGPVVVIKPQRIFYERVTPEDVAEVVSETMAHGRIVDRLLYSDPTTGRKITYEHEVPFYQLQTRVVLDQNGLVDPTSITDYMALGGYGALSKALHQLTPEAVIGEIKTSTLRGRGGAGFPTGIKWGLCRQAKGEPKYVICNADEGDPGAYMDRSVMEGNPHRVLEGMIIGAYAMGAAQGFIYIRNEYPLAVKHVRLAIAAARGHGLLGKDILGSGFDFDVEIRLGSGAFVCGEETALMASIEGRIGEPRPRPPFPAQSGLWGKPTNINNVETWANVPQIIQRGAVWFAGLGTAGSGGTKIFSVVGKINNTGLVEVPVGTPLGNIIYDIGGGVPKGKEFKAAQIGGPSGGCIPRQHLNVPIDYNTLQELGAIMGSGGLVVCDEDTCMVELARYFLSFVQEESCGKCVPCRVGTKAMLETLERICAGEGREGDVEYLIELAGEIKRSSLCALGGTAPNPVLTTIRYFRHEYDAHIREKRCPAGACQALVVAPCINECPVGTDVPSYVSLVGEGRLEEALATILDTNPFPSVCGRVCNHRCEAKCRRNQVDSGVAIRALKRFVADSVGQRPAMAPAEDNAQPKVGIFGAGPAGLSCAYFLARLGYRPTVFEKLPVAGGMLRVGIPEYRLPRDTLQAEIAAIEAMGVEIRTSTALGADVTLDGLRQEGYKAFLLALGAHGSQGLGVQGEELDGVAHAVDFLRDAGLNGKRVWVGRRVAVVGGGNAAVDAARTARRLGAEEVTIVYRRTRAEMPAEKAEIDAAEAEGIDLQCLASPVRIIGNGHGVEALEVQRMRLGEFDHSGRRRPEPVEGAMVRLEVDMVIPAIGQVAQASGVCDGLEVDRRRGVIVADKDGHTCVPDVFAGGDAASGPATVIEAIAAGERAAVAIDQYLHPGAERDYSWRHRRPVDTKFDPQAEPVPYGRCGLPELDPKVRRRSFDEVERVLDRETAMREALRCLRCDYREGEE
jgi:NADH-quinone oxidoreductase subunit F